MKLYALFVSYESGDHYIGVYPSLEHLHGVIKEMAADMKISKSEVPSVKTIEGRLAETDSFWTDFSDSTWITVQEVSDKLVDLIEREVFSRLGKSGGEVKKNGENRKPVSKRHNKVRR